MKLQGLRIALAGALALGLAACGSSSSNDGPARINVRLVDAPGDYVQLFLDVREVQINGPDGWQTLGTWTGGPIDLLTLTNGVSETLAENAPIAAGHYGQMRLLLGPNNTVVVDGIAEPQPLKVPSGMQSGVKLNVNFDVEPGTTKDVFIDFDAHKSIFVHRAGNSDQYILRPVVRAFDQVVTGTISGTVTAGGTAVAGAQVMIETVEGGAPSVVRSTVTGADGKYSVGLLPVAATYYVVTQPVIGGTVYQTFASGPIALTAAAPLPVQDVALTVAAEHGGINGTVTPIATDTQRDLLQVIQPFGATPVNLIVREVTPVVAATETFAAPDLPTGAYSLVLTRDTFDANGDQTGHAVAAPVAATVTNGATANVALTAP